MAALGDTLYAIDGALGAGHLESTNQVEALDVNGRVGTGGEEG